MILEIRRSKEDPIKAEIWASGDRVENVTIVKAVNDHGRRSVVVEIFDIPEAEKSTRKKGIAKEKEFEKKEMDK